MIFTYLNHSSQWFGPQERHAIEKFLWSFIPVLFMFPPHEFNSTCGPLAPGHDEDPSEEQSTSINEEPVKTALHAAKHQHAQEGVSAQDLHTRLLKTAQENGQPKPQDTAGNEFDNLHHWSTYIVTLIIAVGLMGATAEFVSVDHCMWEHLVIRMLTAGCSLSRAQKQS